MCVFSFLFLNTLVPLDLKRYAMASAEVHAADAQTLQNLTSQLSDLDSTLVVYSGIEKLANEMHRK